MAKVEINADGRAITVEHDAELAVITDAAFDLWKQTEAPSRTGPGSAGFQMERARQWDHDRTNPMR